MATVPIEIILQDAETPVGPTPTPTPESGEETDIVVPSTGTISNDGSNNGGIGSAIGIMLPIVITVLALGTMVALLVRRQQKRKNNINANMSKKEKFFTATSGTIVIFAATVLVGNLVIPATKAATNVEPGTAELDTVDKITITATREIDSDITIATVKNTSYATANLDFGYKVTASMIEGATTANLYLNGDETSEYYIAPVENEDEGDENIENENTAGNAELANNMWGYTLEEPSEDTTYLPIPLVGTPATITKGNDTVEDEAVDIYYAIKVDKDLPAGSYMGELKYNISPAVEYMQDFATMTEEEKTATLANMPEGEQYILKDIRDKKPYYISKLADGNVWMTQNLDLDIDENTTYTHTDTDLGWNDPNNLNPNAKWKPDEGHSTISFTGNTVEGWLGKSLIPYSANPGDIYYYTSGTGANDMRYDSLADCEEDHKDGSCPHYHAGNYYNWSAAVAMNDTSGYGDDDQYVNVETSICPAGWKLPNGKQNNEESRTSVFSEMLFDYNILNEYYLDGGFNAMRINPIWLIRSGYIGGAGSLENDSVEGGYWSSTVHTADGIYYLSFNSESINPAEANSRFNRYNGYSTRCIMR